MTSSSKETLLSLEFNDILNLFKKYRRQISKRFVLIEFAKNYITIAEAQFRNHKIQIRKIKREMLPKEAIEKGIPTDPETMAELIRDIMTEQNIYTLRAALIIPTESAYTRIIKLPINLSIEEAYEYVANPLSDIQIPIPIQQSEFYLNPVPKNKGSNKNSQKYFLSSVPRKTINTLLKTIELSGLQLYFIDLEFNCQLRLISKEVSQLKQNERVLHLELLTDCTHYTLAGQSGPIDIKRLTSIRNYPDPFVKYSSEEIENIKEEDNNKSTTKYLSITELDLRALLKQIVNRIIKLKAASPNSSITKIFLSGVNASHPGITKIVGNTLGIPTFLISSSNNPYISNLDFSPEIMLEQSLGSIVGIAYSITNKDSRIDNDLQAGDIFYVDSFMPKSEKDISSIYKNEISNKELRSQTFRNTKKLEKKSKNTDTVINKTSEKVDLKGLNLGNNKDNNNVRIDSKKLNPDEKISIDSNNTYNTEIDLSLNKETKDKNSETLINSDKQAINSSEQDISTVESKKSKDSVQENSKGNNTDIVNDLENKRDNIITDFTLDTKILDSKSEDSKKSNTPNNADELLKDSKSDQTNDDDFTLDKSFLK